MATEVRNTEVVSASLNIGGMTCAACVYHVERALVGVPGVAKANVNLGVERATVEYQPGVVGLEDLRRAVEDAGYRVEAAGDQQGELERLSKVRETKDLGNRLVVAAIGGVLLFLGAFGGFPWVPRLMGTGLLPVLVVGAGDTGAVLGRGTVLSLRPGRGAARQRQYAHAYCHRHRDRLRVQRRSGVARSICPVSADKCGPRWKDFLRNILGNHCPGPGRTLPGGPGTRSDFGGDSAPDGASARHSYGGPGRRRSGRPRGAGCRRRSAAGQAGGEHSC